MSGLVGDGNAAARGFQLRAKQYLELPQEDPISQMTYSLVNARIMLHRASEQWEVGLGATIWATRSI